MAVAAEHLVTSPGIVPGPFDALYAFWTRFDAPEGWRVEIVEGALRMTPNPAKRHTMIAALLNRVLVDHVPSRAMVFHSAAIKLDDQARLYLPDVVVASPDDLVRLSELAPANALLTVEITSPSNARWDREEKRDAYAHGGVPLYLLVDPVAKHPTVTLYSDPVDGEYQHVEKVPFGDVLHLPEPFDVDLDTSQFPR